MRRIFFSLLPALFFYSAVCQTSAETQEIVGKWKFDGAEITIDNKKEADIGQDTNSVYIFRADRTYSLFAKDLWGKAEVKGNWKVTSDSIIKLFNIVHVSEVKGVLPTSAEGYSLVLRKFQNDRILYLASYDKQLDWFNELYYIKVP
jgi:hypothetical protein